MVILTYNFRIKDNSKKDLLKKLSGHVNFVWNYTNEVIRKRWKESRLKTYRTTLNPLIAGTSSFLEINSQSIQAAAYECLQKTQQEKKFIRFRSGKKNLGWVPFNGQTIKFHGSYIDYNGYRFRIWDHRQLPKDAVIKAGSFSEDARGRWYLNLQVEVSDEGVTDKPEPKNSIGIDPGVKTVLTLSDGTKFERESITKKYAAKLANAQRHGKKKQVKTLNAKIKNSRKDFNHKVSLQIARKFELIFFGDAEPKKLSKTRMAKGVLDASWYQVKTFLRYKTMRRGGRMLEVSEKNSTVTCWSCLSKTGPSGLSGLGVREWTCPNCSTVHDRDVTGAKNILRFGHETLKALTC